MVHARDFADNLTIPRYRSSAACRTVISPRSWHQETETADGQSTGPTSDADDDDDEEEHELSDVPTEQLAAILPIFHLLIERSICRAVDNLAGRAETRGSCWEFRGAKVQATHAQRRVPTALRTTKTDAQATILPPFSQRSTPHFFTISHQPTNELASGEKMAQKREKKPTFQSRWGEMPAQPQLELPSFFAFRFFFFFF